jgi:hypothetical protein
MSGIVEMIRALETAGEATETNFWLVAGSGAFRVSSRRAGGGAFGEWAIRNPFNKN